VKQQQSTKHGQNVRLLASPLWYCPVQFPSYPSNSVHCYALFNIFRVDHVRLLRFSSFSSYLTENSPSQLLLLDRPLFLRPQPVPHTEGSLSTLQLQMTSLYAGIHTKNNEFRHVPTLRKVGYTWCQQGPETNAFARPPAKYGPSEQTPDFSSPIITYEEPWIRHYNPDSKQ